MSIDSFQFLLEAIVESTTYYRNVLAAIGAVLIAKKCVTFSINLYNGVRTFVFGRVRPMALRQLGAWAVVSGPTSGIGEAFVLEFAKLGLNVVLLGRNVEKLNDLANLIRKNYNVAARCILIDFGEELQSYDGVKQMFDTLDVAVCVNNVGMITEYPAYLYETTDHDINEMINVNVKSVTIMTKMAVKHMQKKGRGLIVNVSSMAAFGPTPLMSVYAATKAFVSSFSQAVNAELSSTGVSVQTLTPSYVKTRMIGYSPELNSSWLVPSPSNYVQNALTTFGYSCHTSGYWLHGLEFFILSLLPAGSWIGITKRANTHFRQKYMSRRQD